LPEDDTVGDAIERLEWGEKRSGDVSKAAQITRRTALTGGAAGLAAVLLEACGSSDGTGTTNASGTSGSLAPIFGVTGGYRFAFVNHVTNNTFFVPTISGIEDACRLLNCSYEWTGSGSNNASEMASAINNAVSAGVDGIATSLIATSLRDPVDAAIDTGIPVVSYNADDPSTSRLAYVGQDLLRSGREMAHRIRSLIPDGGKIVVFVATPGSANLAPRVSGIEQSLNGSNIEVHFQASGAAEAQEATTIGAFVGQHLDSYSGYFAVDGGSTAAVAQAIKDYSLQGRVLGGGFDLTPNTQALLYGNYIQFAIDQQPYLQGFLPVMQLFLHRAAQGLTGAADVDTGVSFFDPKTVAPYYRTNSRYEGTSTAVGVQKS
jgi:simple sugar transport system substrate-binding protein